MDKFNIFVSKSTCALAAGAQPVSDALRDEAKSASQQGIDIVNTGCMGLCYCEPTVEVYDSSSGKSILYGNVKPEHAPIIIASGLSPAQGINIIEKNWFYPETEENIHNATQARIVLKNSGRIDPENIDHYIREDGYTALNKALSSPPEEIIHEVTRSGLRGRGGGGFPAGVKWQTAFEQTSDEKYIICNADEGDPGAFMDRAVLEGDPHSVIEAMAITGYAVGSATGIIYIRAEYPLAIKRLETALAQARQRGYLGKDISGSSFSFDIEIKYGAGAFVCGEETALIASIEGRRGEPVFKPPYPAISGLWGKPTVVNNVETFANIPAIIRKGADWFRTIGTEKSPGTKVFALAGKINNVGLIEVPMGIRLREVIFNAGKGITNNKAFKAVQTGGPSGGCITAKDLDTPIEYDTLKALGSIMGSGGMIVMDEDDCMVNVARYFLEFTLDESCGKCTPCRIGNKRLHEMLTDICSGKAERATLAKLRTLSAIIKDASLCGLGQSSPNPVISTLHNFEAEYLNHIIDHTCPAGICKKLIVYSINENCTGCTVCARNCPVSCIAGERKKKHTIDQKKCIKCGVCFDSCKFHAINKK